MTNEIVKDQGMLSKGNVVDTDRAVTKHEHFLALLKKQYGYTNEKAIDELERLLKLFSTMNKSLGIHHVRTNFDHPQISALKKGDQNFTMPMHASRKGESHEKRSRIVD